MVLEHESVVMPGGGWGHHLPLRLSQQSMLLLGKVESEVVVAHTVVAALPIRQVEVEAEEEQEEGGELSPLVREAMHPGRLGVLHHEDADSALELQHDGYAVLQWSTTHQSTQEGSVCHHHHQCCPEIDSASPNQAGFIIFVAVDCLKKIIKDHVELWSDTPGLKIPN